MEKLTKITLSILLAVAIIVFTSRLTTPREIDDITPGIPCEQKYIDKSDILWVIPKFQGIPISENQTWCKEILNLNKTLGLHGLLHYYHEFSDPKEQAHIDEGAKIFKDCFGYKPTIFKAPNLALLKDNKILLFKNNLSYQTKLDQSIHKVYHCNNSGTFPNWFHNIW
ncbi:MAG: hypothetical protein PF542_00110 [Nanoarchaeota archaeon]|jgi:predicted deacetylase|nr:hypothetical protein [Nanoarchaeota archaeon]